MLSQIEKIIGKDMGSDESPKTAFSINMINTQTPLTMRKDTMKETPTQRFGRINHPSLYKKEEVKAAPASSMQRMSTMSGTAVSKYLPDR